MTSAEQPTVAAEADEHADTPAATEPEHQAAAEADTGRLDEDQADDEHQDDEPADGGTFPRAVVEKLRGKNAALRDRAKTAEATVQALQTQIAEQQIAAAGMKPAAVWAVVELADVLDDAGTVDTDKLNAAMRTATKQLGATRRVHVPGPGGGAGLASGATGTRRPDPGPGWSTAFGPRRPK